MLPGADAALWWDAREQAFPPGYDPATLSLSAVDEGIRALVRAANATGWLHTLQSCAGHAERDVGPFLDVRLKGHADIPRLCEWVDNANVLRSAALGSSLKSDRLIALVYVGAGSAGATYWRIAGRAVSASENAHIIAALQVALGNGR